MVPCDPGPPRSLASIPASTIFWIQSLTIDRRRWASMPAIYADTLLGYIDGCSSGFPFVADFHCVLTIEACKQRIVDLWDFFFPDAF